jgi:hypothetical protein
VDALDRVESGGNLHRRDAVVVEVVLGHVGQHFRSKVAGRDPELGVECQLWLPPGALGRATRPSTLAAQGGRWRLYAANVNFVKGRPVADYGSRRSAGGGAGQWDWIQGPATRAAWTRGLRALAQPHDVVLHGDLRWSFDRDGPLPSGLAKS